MTHTIRVPTPVYNRLTDTAADADVSHGAVVREWMYKADMWDDHGPASPSTEEIDA
jgi:hypothetical protein